MNETLTRPSGPKPPKTRTAVGHGDGQCPSYWGGQTHIEALHCVLEQGHITLHVNKAGSTWHD